MLRRKPPDRRHDGKKAVTKFSGLETMKFIMRRPNRLIRFLLPPPQWRLPVIVLLGAFTGLAFYLLKISNATSYLSDDPRSLPHGHTAPTGA